MTKTKPANLNESQEITKISDDLDCKYDLQKEMFESKKKLVIIINIKY